MDAAGDVNVYLNAEEPWKVVKTDLQRGGTILWTALQAIAGLRIAFSPYLPHTSARLGAMLGGEEAISGWERPTVKPGTAFGEIAPLFTKLEPDVFDE
jgi:methionyl-tRNA synthetase